MRPTRLLAFLAIGLAAVSQHTTGTDADWVVKVVDVSPDSGTNANYQQLVRGDVFRGKFRKSFSKPEAFVPGKPTSVHFALGDICHTFKAGHRLQIQVQSSWFPLVDRNPQKFMDIGKANDSDFQKATQTIFHSQKLPSRIRFTVKP
ncbi:CocE/NonD family hydrolase C-terminal non-catalytic domain-containing protein [Armatimonas sp.]|uniref:CocE/NonD family hydrolase C-terminal non-catalytic domain-containing protein n=1 Tax=Armatimonas sp. TaxID=1872638 RepID=UPI00374D4003